MEKMKPIAAIKKYFEQADKITPEGGRKFQGVAEFKGLTQEDKTELGMLACKELGCEFEPA